MVTKGDIKCRAKTLRSLNIFNPPILLLLLLLPLLVPTLASGAVVEGRVVMATVSKGSETTLNSSVPVSGISICAFTTFSDLKPVGCSAPSNREGNYSLMLPTGIYHLSGFNVDSTLFAFSGKTSVAVTDSQPTWLGLQAVPVIANQIHEYDVDTSGGIGGKLYFDGKPLATAFLYLYHADDVSLRGQGYRISLPTEQDGSFQFDDLPADSYLLVARKRQSGSKVGPVVAGDYVAFVPNWLVTIADGEQIDLQLNAITKTEDQSETGGKNQPILQGIVTDEKGEPVKGVHIFAYRNRVIGHQQPTALSPTTKNDGTFRIILPDAGIFYIGAREYYGDSPEPGELFGLYEGSTDHGMKLGTGEKRTDIIIRVEPVKIQ